VKITAADVSLDRLLAGIGYYFEWYTFSASVNKEKFKEDMGSVKDKLHGKPSEKAIE
jgi:hypothetical protein